MSSIEKSSAQISNDTGLSQSQLVVIATHRLLPN